MDNVYDLVADFYDNDDGWNQVLRREYAEGFLRREAWHGKNDPTLQKEWGYILMLCIYLGHGEKYLGDLNADDLVDIVAWSGRNVSDFPVTYKNVKNFLGVIGDLFVYLKNEHAISSSLSPRLAQNMLLRDDGTLAIISSGGEFLPGEEKRNEEAMPDSPNKIFLNVGETLSLLLEELHKFFQKDSFNLDLERAVFFYQGFANREKRMEEAESEEFWQCFWDYFLFDYHLIRDDKTPLEHFADLGESHYQALVKELCKARLALFMVEELQDDDLYLCRDFLTDDTYVLNLPLSEDMDTKDMLIIGHIFYNKTMVMNYVRCFQIPKIGRKRLKDQLENFYNWYKIQEPTGTKEDFVARHPMVVRRLTYYAAHSFQLGTFNYETKVQNYIPESSTAGKDEVVICIEKMMMPQHFSYRDVSLATRLWKDFSALETNAIRSPEVWASGVVENYVRLNGVYSYSPQSIANMCWHVPLASLRSVSAAIKEKLKLETHDPRYCNEEGFLMMMFAEKLN